MIEFFVFFFILFAILLGSILYYHFLEKSQKSHINSSEKDIKTSKHKNENHNFFLLISLSLFLVLVTLIMSFIFIKVFTQNIFIIYMGTIAFVMLTAFFFFIIQSPFKLIYAFLSSSLLIGIQIYFKVPLLGGLLLTLGYIGIVNYFLSRKILSAKTILIFLIVYMLYDFATVFLTFLQFVLMTKTINNIFPAALIYGKTSLGIGDVLFTLIMTSFARVYYGSKLAILTALLVSLPLAGLGVYIAFFPQQSIGLPYLVLSTPMFLVLVLIMSLNRHPRVGGDPINR